MTTCNVGDFLANLTFNAVFWIIILYVIYFAFTCIFIFKTDFKEAIKNDSWEKLAFFFSGTLFLASYRKYRCENNDKIKEVKAKIIREHNQFYLIVTLLMLDILYLMSHLDASIIKGILLSFILFYSLSRVNEVFFAFINDARSKLSSHSSSSNLQYYERIKLAMVSYIEIILLYGILQFVLPSYGFDGVESNDNPIKNIWEAIYFSGITIATIGYGDLTPKSSVSQFLAIYEVINGFVLIVVSFTIYVSRSITEEEYKTTITIRKIEKDGGIIYKCNEFDKFDIYDEKLEDAIKKTTEHLLKEKSTNKKYKNYKNVVVKCEIDLDECK